MRVSMNLFRLGGKEKFIRKRLGPKSTKFFASFLHFFRPL